MHVIHAYTCYYRTDRMTAHICGILQASHSGLKQQEIDLFVAEITERHRCLRLKRCGPSPAVRHHVIRCIFHRLKIYGKILLRHIFLIYLKSLKICKYRRRYISSHTVSCTLKYLVQKCAYRTFAICSCYMYNRDCVLRIAQPSQQLLYTVKPQNASHGVRIFYITSCLFISHGIYPSLLICA